MLKLSRSNSNSNVTESRKLKALVDHSMAGAITVNFINFHQLKEAIILRQPRILVIQSGIMTHGHNTQSRLHSPQTEAEGRSELVPGDK